MMYILMLSRHYMRGAVSPWIREHNLEHKRTERNGTKHDAKKRIKMPFYDFSFDSRTYLNQKKYPTPQTLPHWALGFIYVTLKARHYIFDILENYDLNCSEGS